MATTTAMGPRGHYAAREVGVLAGVSGDRIGQWARRGYIRSSQSSRPPRVYSYQDVAEAIVVHELEDAQVPLKVIRKSIEHLRVTYGDWPLTTADLTVTRPGHVDEISRLLVREDGNYFDADKERWQTVLEAGNLRRIARDLQRGGWVVRDLPDIEHIEVHPDRLSGRPAIRGRRLLAEDVGATAATDAGRAILRQDYDLTDAEISDAQRWWAAVRAREAS